MATARNKPAEATAAVGFPGDEDYEAGTGDWDAADALLGAVVRTASFPEIGTSYSGVVVDTKVDPQTDIDGEVRRFDNGDVRMQVIVTIQTALADDDDDDGQRRIFVKGAMVKSFRAEMARNKVKGLRPGGVLAVTYEADGEQPKKGLNPPKLFTVVYEPPAA